MKTSLLPHGSIENTNAPRTTASGGENVSLFEIRRNPDNDPLEVGLGYLYGFANSPEDARAVATTSKSDSGKENALYATPAQVHFYGGKFIVIPVQFDPRFFVPSSPFEVPASDSIPCKALHGEMELGQSNYVNREEALRLAAENNLSVMVDQDAWDGKEKWFDSDWLIPVEVSEPVYDAVCDFNFHNGVGMMSAANSMAIRQVVPTREEEERYFPPRKRSRERKRLCELLTFRTKPGFTCSLWWHINLGKLGELMSDTAGVDHAQAVQMVREHNARAAATGFTSWMTFDFIDSEADDSQQHALMEGGAQ